MNIEFEITELHRRLSNLVAIGTVAEANYDGPIPLVKIKSGEILTGWLPLLTLRAGPDRHWWPVEVGEQVVVVSPSGDLSQGIVVGSINQSQSPANAHSPDQLKVDIKDGSSFEYDRNKHCLKILLAEGATTEVVSDGGMKIKADIDVDGSIMASGDIRDHTRSMQADRDIYNGHDHGGVTSGFSNTLAPSQSQ